MPLLDNEGRVLGKLNIFDLFVVAVVVVLSALAYHKLSAPHRVAPPFELEENRAVMAVELQLPADNAWMCDYAKPGLAEVDPRTGAPTAEVLGCATESGPPVVSLRVHAVRDGSGRVLFEGQPLLPGRLLDIDTEAAIFSGVVRSAMPAAP